MILLALAAAAAATGAPARGALHTYKDWTVGCDNVRTCQANALAPDTGGDRDTLMLLINRDGTPGAGATISVPMPDKIDPGTPLELAIDGKPAAAFAAAKDAVTLPLTREMLSALAEGKRIALRKAGSTDLVDTSLSGLAAAMLYIDDQQKRVGTVGALKATGPTPDSSVPAPPLAPLVMTPPPSAKPPRTISVRHATALIGPDNAKCDYASSKVAPAAHRLDAMHSLVLVDHPCGNGAYNYFTSAYILDETGPPRPAAYDVNPGMADDTDLTNAAWDDKTRTISTLEKGRGLGDCGSAETYAWDGRRFRLIKAESMGECRGSVDYIRVWTARTRP